MSREIRRTISSGGKNMSLTGKSWRTRPPIRVTTRRPPVSIPDAITGPKGVKVSKLFARVHCAKAGSSRRSSTAETSFTQV